VQVLVLLTADLHCAQSLVISYSWYLKLEIILLRGECHEFSKRVHVGVYHAIGMHIILNENSK
jgi:hypothetical protein